MLLSDPRDPSAFAAALQVLLSDPERSRCIGEAGRERVRDRFLGIRQLEDYTAILERLLA